MRRSRAGVVEFKFALGVPLRMLVMFMVVSGAQAQNSASGLQLDDNEVLIGTADAGSAGSAGSEIAQDHNSRSSADYDRAMTALESGDSTAAERLFEKVIANDPHGPQAADSRRHLGQLYTSQTAPPSLATVPPAQNRRSAPVDQLSRETKTRFAGEDDGPDQSGTASRGPDVASDEERFLTEAGDRIFFANNSAELGGRARAILSAQAGWLNKRPEWNLTIEGHADDPPLAPAELEQLSESRAQAVRKRLLDEGVAAERIAVISYGRTAPISDCPEVACQVQNRRAVSVLTPRRKLDQQSGTNWDNRRRSTTAEQPWATAKPLNKGAMSSAATSLSGTTSRSETMAP